MKIKVLTPLSEIKEIEVAGTGDVEILVQQGYTILSTKKTLPKLSIRFTKISVRFLSEFFRDLAGFLSVGIPIQQAVEELEKTTANKKEKKMLKEIKEKMAEGMFLYQILSDLEFPEEAVLSVKAGEKGSVLQKTFEQLAWYYEQVLSFQSKLKSSFIYPAFVFVLTFIVATCISIFVVPKIREFLIAIPNLPKITQFFLMLTSLLAKGWWTIPAFFIVVGLALKWVFTSERASKVFVSLWNTKMFSLVKERIFAKFFLELYTLLENGIHLTEALDIIEVGNKYFEKTIERVKEKLSAGYSFSQSLSVVGIFPSFVIQTISKGESAGLLTEYIKTISDFYWKRIEAFQKAFGELFGHILVVVIGIGVGLFAGVFLFSIYSALPKITTFTTIK